MQFESHDQYIWTDLNRGTAEGCWEDAERHLDLTCAENYFPIWVFPDLEVRTLPVRSFPKNQRTEIITSGPEVLGTN